MATALKLRANIKKLKAAIESKSTNARFIPKFKEQLEKAEKELASMKKGAAPKKSAKKPATSNLQKLISKKNSKYKGYKGSGVDIKKDAERPAKPIGKRKSKSGNTYYEYRLNRTDIKQPPKKYPKLEDGGMMENGGFFDKKEEVVFKFKEGEKIKVLQYSGGKLKPMDATIYQHYAAEQPNGTYYPFYWVVGSWENFDEGKKHPLLYAEDELIYRHKNKPKMADGGMMAKGGDTKFRVGQSILLKPITNKYVIDALPEWNKYANKEIVIEKIEFDIPHKKATKAFVRSTGDKVPFNFYLNDSIKKYADGGMMAKGGEILYLKSVGTYFRPSDMTVSPMKDFKNEGEITSINDVDDEWIEGLSDSDKKIIEKYKKEYFADGGKIKDQYDGREPEDIWNNLSASQRQHFLYDHKSEIEMYRGEEFGELSSTEIIKAYNSDYDKLDKHITNRFNNHVREGQYAKGGYMAKGGGVGEFESIMKENLITEKQILLIKRRLNANKDDSSVKDVVDYIWDEKPYLTSEQNKKGLEYLINLWKTPTGKERSNNPFGYREEEALETFESFQLSGFYNISTYYGMKPFYVPLYIVNGKETSFEYYIDSKGIHIVGEKGMEVKDANMMTNGGAVNYLKRWRVKGITFNGKMFEKEITLGRLSTPEDVKNALKRMYDTNIREVTVIEEKKEEGGYMADGADLPKVHSKTHRYDK